MAAKKNSNYNFYFMQDGKPVEIKRSAKKCFIFMKIGT